MILIVAAMNEEYRELQKLMEQAHEQEINNVTHTMGLLDDKEVVLMLSGIGKVNASMNVTSIINEYDIDFIINIGSAGGIKDLGLSQLDLVLATKVCQHDIDLHEFGHEYGALPNMPVYYESALDDKMIDQIKELNIPYQTGCVASGDQFVSQEEKVNYILEHFDDVCATDMEAGAIAQVAYIHHIPFIIIRSISDIIDEKDSKLQFQEYIIKASSNSALATEKIISAIKS